MLTRQTAAQAGPRDLPCGRALARARTRPARHRGGREDGSPARGQIGRTCRRWFEKGIRPRGRRDLRHDAVYLFGAVCPDRDHGVALVLPR